MSARRASWLIPLIGYAIAVASLVWVYRGFNWKAELADLADTNWWWVALAVIADISVYVCQGFRWSVLLRPLKPVGAWRSIQAIYIGLFTNEVLPLRSGEVIRCYLQSRWSGLPFAAVLPSIVLERVFDGLWLLVGFYAASRYVVLPRLLVQGAQVLGLALLAVSVVLLIVAIRRGAASANEPAGRWAHFLRPLVPALQTMGRSASLSVAALLSLLYLALQVVPVYALIRAVDLELSIWAATVVLIVLRLGSVPPQAPSNVGAFQFFTVLGLQLQGIEKSEAVSFATLLFFVVTVPLWMGGLVALLATRMRLAEIRREAAEAGRESKVY